MDSLPHAMRKIPLEHAPSAALASPPYTSSAPNGPPPAYTPAAPNDLTAIPAANDDESCLPDFDIYNTYSLCTSPDPTTSPEPTPNNDDEAYEPDPSPVTLTLNANTTICGTNNIVPQTSSPLADATRFSALLLHAINKLNAAATEVSGTASNSSGVSSGVAGVSGGDDTTRRPAVLHVNLTINAGLTVLGHGNVVGNLDSKRAAGVGAGAAVGRGKKRKITHHASGRALRKVKIVDVVE